MSLLIWSFWVKECYVTRSALPGNVFWQIAFLQNHDMYPLPFISLLSLQPPGDRVSTSAQFSSPASKYLSIPWQTHSPYLSPKVSMLITFGEKILWYKFMLIPLMFVLSTSVTLIRSGCKHLKITDMIPRSEGVVMRLSLQCGQGTTVGERLRIHKLPSCGIFNHCLLDLLSLESYFTKWLIGIRNMTTISTSLPVLITLSLD